ncbi:MAG TPA: hypothetical protein VHC73_16110 [Vitreimonas sp.]|jgi:MFS family permease|nr:hypothetical protein [Vitreimonas sp.]
METAFKSRASSGWTSAGVSLAMMIPFLFAALITDGFGRGFSLAIACVCLIALVLSVRAATDTRDILKIGPDGLFYRPFAPKPAPWSEITAIAMVRTYQQEVLLGHTNMRRTPQLDTLNFALAHPENWPSHPGRSVSRFFQAIAKLPPIAIQTWFIDATPEQLADAIRPYWKGEIKQVDLYPRLPGAPGV